MASAFDRMFAEQATPLLLEQYGERVLYTPKGGSARWVTAIVRWQEGVGEFSRPDGRQFREACEVDVKVAECPELGLGDQFALDGAAFRIDRIPRSDAAGIATTACIRLATRDKGAPNRMLPTGG